MFTIRNVRSIGEVDRDQWDAIAGDNAFATYGWLKTVEDTYLAPGTPHYILLEENGRLAGGAVCRFQPYPETGISLDHRILGRVRRAVALTGFSFHPAMVCGPTRSIGRHFLVEPSANLERTARIDDALLDWVENEAAANGHGVLFLQVREDEQGLADQLTKRKFGRTVWDPVNYLDIEWPTFEEYRSHIRNISRNMESNIRKEVNRNRREGVRIVNLETVSGYEERLNALLNANNYKHNGAPFPYSHAFFSRLKENMGSNAIIYAAFKKDVIIGVCVMMKRNRNYILPFVGVDHKLSGNDATYFNIVFYRPIMDAITDNVKRIYFGVAMYELKEKRGCRVMNTYSYYKSNDRIKNMAVKTWFSIRSRWWRRKYSRYINRPEISNPPRSR